MLQLLVLSVLLSLACWRILRRFLFSNVLDYIPGPAPTSLLWGSLTHLHSTKGWKFHHEISETYGGIIKLKGLLGANILYVSDPKALHHILIKDQYIYEETENFIETNRMMFGEGIFTSLGDRHRLQRKMLNPVFSIAHMRNMVPIFYEVSHNLRDSFVKMAQAGPHEVDILSWMTRCALELIGRTGLGYSFDTLAEDSVPHPYGLASKALVPMQPESLWARTVIMPMIPKLGPAKFRRAVVDALPIESIRTLRDIVDTLHKTSVEIYESKKKAIEEGDEAITAQIGEGKDIISILMKENMKASEDDKLSEVELLGQVNSLTFAATDTTSGALSRIFHLLALNKDVQDKLRKEIRDAKEANDGHDLGYDVLVSLPFLDAVCRETLRLYPPVTMLNRAARQDIILPLATPIRGTNGKDIMEIPIPKGTEIFISIMASNRNPELWGPDALEWKPERWLSPLPEALVEARVPGVYSHLLTFLGGGRSCIGFKFSQLEMKVVLTLLLDVLEFNPSDKQIYWQMFGVVAPNTDMESKFPTLPMKISLSV
ncbi:cytochrome P450 [Crassisporium funariophilum]|nr:cytochrome P450 [Crassisporium funariophilum]